MNETRFMELLGAYGAGLVALAGRASARRRKPSWKSRRTGSRTSGRASGRSITCWRWKRTGLLRSPWRRKVLVDVARPAQRRASRARAFGNWRAPQWATGGAIAASLALGFAVGYAGEPASRSPKADYPDAFADRRRRRRDVHHRDERSGELGRNAVQAVPVPDRVASGQRGAARRRRWTAAQQAQRPRARDRSSSGYRRRHPMWCRQPGRSFRKPTAPSCASSCAIAGWSLEGDRKRLAEAGKAVHDAAMAEPFDEAKLRDALTIFQQREYAHAAKRRRHPDQPSWQDAAGSARDGRCRPADAVQRAHAAHGSAIAVRRKERGEGGRVTEPVERRKSAVSRRRLRRPGNEPARNAASN